MSGKFITLEGSEGAGKSTQAKLIEEYFHAKEMDVLVLREPGGVKISEAIRQLLLDVKNEEMNPQCEVLLYMAARAQLVREQIEPALEAGKVVLCDRFMDSTIAYQGYGIGVDVEQIKQIGLFATSGVIPDMTFLFDIDTEQGLSRTNAEKDRIEQRPLDYHQRVRTGYLSLASSEPGRVRLIKVDRPAEQVFEDVKQHLDQLF